MKTPITILAIMISSLLCCPATVSAGSPDAVSSDTTTVVTRSIVRLKMPVSLTVRDMISKVYGFIDPQVSRQQCLEALRVVADMTPQEDDYGMWLNEETGYGVSYYGMRPEVEARVQFEGKEGSASEYGFFFLFPYARGDRQNANDRQAEFCGYMLQELNDMGLEIGQTRVTDALFEVVGDYAGNIFNIRLVEEFTGPDGENRADAMTSIVEAASIPDVEGRFVVVLQVEPDAFTPADSLASSD